MAHTIFVGAVEFLIRATFLLGALWITIKVLKLECNFPGLVASVILISVLAMVLDRFVGVYFSVPFICIALYLCLWQVTGANRVNVFFPVGVGGVLVFGMNVFLLGALMGDLRPSAKQRKPGERVAEYPLAARTNEPMAVAQVTNTLTEATNAVAPATNTPAEVMNAMVPTTN